MANNWTDKTWHKKTMALVVGQKGGIGKSVKAVTVIEYGRMQGYLVAAYDADAVISSTFMTLATRGEDNRFLAEQDPLKGVVRYNLRDAEQADLLLNSLDSGAPTVVHDMPGGTIADIERLIAGPGAGGFGDFLEALDAAQYSLTLLHLVTPDPTTIVSVRGYLDAFGDRARHVVVLNKAFEGPNQGFEEWQKSKTRKTLELYGGREIAMPALHSKLGSAVRDQRRPLLDPTRDHLLPFTERRRFHAFREQYKSEVSKIEDWLF